jgi:uncharacterized protein
MFAPRATACVLLLAFICTGKVWAESAPPAATAADHGVPDSLQSAAARGDLAAIDALLASGSAIDARNAEGYPALIIALKKHQFASTEHLLARGADPNQRDSSHYTATTFAFWAGLAPDYAPSTYDDRWLRLLLDHGAHVDAIMPYREPLLTEVATCYPPQPSALRLLLAYHPPVDQIVNDHCETALYQVVYQETRYPEGKHEIIRQLLAAGADPNHTIISNSYVGGAQMNYPTPLLAAAAGLDRSSPDNLESAAETTARTALLTLLLAHGGNPRNGGIGGVHQDNVACPPQAEGEPGTSSSAAPAWRDLESSAANPALNQMLEDTVTAPAAFSLIITAAAPIRREELGYPPLYRLLIDYRRVATLLAEDDQAIPPYQQAHLAASRRAALEARRQALENALRTLLALGAPVNPRHLRLPSGESWDNLWASDNIEYLPLYEERLPDDLYRALLEAGAQPALRYSGFWNEPGPSLLRHLISRNAASKLALLRDRLGLLQRVPTWCGRTVYDIADALNRDERGQLPARLATPTGQEAKAMLLNLLADPRCSMPSSLHGQLPSALASLHDQDIAAAWAASALNPAAPPASR